MNIIQSIEKPILLDADALNLIAQQKTFLPCKHHQILFTPHPGEAARLLAMDASTVQQNRFDTIVRLQKMLSGCVVLKGAGTLIKASDATTWVCRQGNAGMAVAGCGDVLSGFMGGLLAQRYSLLQTAWLGVWLHALAGATAVEWLPGKVGLRATALIEPLRYHWNLLLEKKYDQKQAPMVLYNDIMKIR